MSFLELSHVDKGFGPAADRYEVLDDVNLSIDRNEFVAVIGFSGSGKSTLVSLLAGLLQPDAGEVRMNGEVVTEPGPERGVVFQNYSLLPWLTVASNVELAVKQVFPEMSRTERREHVQHFVDLVSLSGAEHKRPHELSGGMRQRVSLARTLSMRPDLLLLDEPLSALDALTRATLQDELVRLWLEDRRTVVMITNDVDEAVLLADRIVPLTPGPNATLGPDFVVDLERPRDRTTLNYDPAFVRLRNRITNYLVDVNAESRQLRVDRAVQLPDVVPADLTTV